MNLKSTENALRWLAGRTKFVTVIAYQLIETTNSKGDISIDLTKDGYTPICVAGYSFSHTYYIPTNIVINTSTNKLEGTIRRFDTSTASETVHFYPRILYQKN